jgi:hypothetical protein
MGIYVAIGLVASILGLLISGGAAGWSYATANCKEQRAILKQRIKGGSVFTIILMISLGYTLLWFYAQSAGPIFDSAARSFVGLALAVEAVPLLLLAVGICLGRGIRLRYPRVRRFSY